MTKSKVKVLVVDDSDEFRAALGEALEEDFEVDLAASTEEAEQKVDRGAGLVLLDVRLRDESANREGLRLLESIKQNQPDLPVVMMTNYGDIDIAVEAMRLGASDFVEKSRVDVREFRKVIDNALKRSRLERSEEHTSELQSRVDISYA